MVDFLISKQKADGHWARTWRTETGEELNDDLWVGDQAWLVMALVRYAEKSGDANALASAQRAADWLASKISANGKVVPSTEGNVDVWWAMIATQRFVEADKIQNYLLTQAWDADLNYWWRGRDNNEHPDPVVAMDCATWVGEFAKSPRVNRPELAHAALSFVRRTLMTTDSSGAFCGFDGMGPVSIWCEGTAQYLVAGGEGAQQYLDMLLTLQRADGGMPGSTDRLSGSCFGWLSKWTGLSSTAWLYFALTHSPFPGADCAPVAVHESAAQLPPDFHLKQNHPNPFHFSTRIEYFIPRAMRVTLKIYDLNAREVMTLVDARQGAGWQHVAFNRAGLAGGVYLIRLKAGDIAHTRKLVIVR
ncbi:T9SS type A sorting domain-containing protein [candidate division KSB1 bacterium]|nr:T9SS type A sorting domain-containing protein [candidate division KSB1 bacterium]